MIEINKEWVRVPMVHSRLYFLQTTVTIKLFKKKIPLYSKVNYNKRSYENWEKSIDKLRQIMYNDYRK